MSETPENDNGNGEIEPRANGVVSTRPAARFVEYARNRAEIEASIVAEELSFDQMDAILSAQTPEELDAAMRIMGVVGLKTFENGAEIQIEEFHFAPGTREEFKNRLGVFVVMRVTVLATGETAFVDTGVERIIAYLRACEVMERFPLQVRVVKEATGRGNEMITLAPLPPRVVPGRMAETAS